MTDEKPPKLSVPEPGAFNHVDKLVRATSSALNPFVAFGLQFIPTNLDKRKDKFVHEVIEILNGLIEQGIVTREGLENNEEFLSIFVKSTQIAFRTHQQEKLMALRNVLINSLTSEGSDNALDEMFLHYVDIFTEWHIAILKFFNDPGGWSPLYSLDYQGDGEKHYEAYLEEAFPDLDLSFCKQVWRDLYNWGLLEGEHPDAVWVDTERLYPRLSEIGKKFLLYISETAVIPAEHGEEEEE